MAVAQKKPAHLSVVDAEAAAQAEVEKELPKPLVDRLNSDSELDVLLATREVVAKLLADPNLPPRDAASLSRRQMELVKSIAAIRAAEQQEADEDADAETEDEDFNAEAV